MKKLFTFLALIFVLASCTWKDEEKIVAKLTEETTKEEKSDNKELIEELKKEIVEESDIIITDDSNGQETETETETDKVDAESSPEDLVVSAWQYALYSPELVKSSSWDKVLFFHATWCPSCKSADENFLSSEIPSGLNIFKVNYDDSTDLKKKYWVLAQHTFVLVDDEGEMIKKWSWGRDVEEILEAIN